MLKRLNRSLDPFAASIAFGIALGFIFILVITLVVIAPWDESGTKQSSLLRFWARSILRVSGIRLDNRRPKHMMPTEAQIIVANHTSHIDIAVVLATLCGRVRFMADEDFFSLPIVGYHLQRIGHVPIPKGNAFGRGIAIRQALRQLTVPGTSLVIFPEGDRTDGQLARFQCGAAYLASRSGVPITPMIIHGANRIMPRGEMLIHQGTIRIVLGDTLPLGPAKTRVEVDMHNRSLWAALRRLSDA